MLQGYTFSWEGGPKMASQRPPMTIRTIYVYYIFILLCYYKIIVMHDISLHHITTIVIKHI